MKNDFPNELFYCIDLNFKIILRQNTINDMDT